MQLIKENNEILERLSKRQSGHQNDVTSSTSPTNDFKDSISPTTDFKGSTSSLKTSPKSSMSSMSPMSYVVQSSPANKPITFNPFPNRQKKKPKEVGLKLGLYPAK
jgi:hypothetical protein